MSGLDIAELTSPGDAGLADLLVAVEQAVALDLDPDDPPPAPVEVLAERFATRRDEPSRVWGGHDGRGTRRDGVDGQGAPPRDVPARPRRREGRPEPAGRREGSAADRALVLRAAIDAGATSVIGNPHDEAGICRAAAVGMTTRQHERLSVLRIADLDDRQQQAWRDGTAAEAAGYALHRFSGTCPEELLPALIDALTVMDDEPLDEVEYERPRSRPRRCATRSGSTAKGGSEVFISR